MLLAVSLGCFAGGRCTPGSLFGDGHGWYHGWQGERGSLRGGGAGSGPGVGLSSSLTLAVSDREAAQRAGAGEWERAGHVRDADRAGAHPG